MKRLLFRGILGVVVIVVLVGFAGVMYADGLVKKGIESGGTAATGQETTVEGVSLGLFSGELGLSGVAVKNPPGYESNFFRLGNGEVRVSLGSLLSDEIEVPVLKIEDLEVTLLKKRDGSNYETILDHIKKMGGGAGGEPSRPSEGGKRLVIRHLELNRITAVVDVEVLGQRKRMQVEVPQIVLKNVGSDSDTGVLLDELSGILIQAVLEAIAREAGNLPAELLGDLRGNLAGLEDVGARVVGDVTSQVQGAAQDALDQIQEQGGELGKQIGEQVGKGLEDLNPLKKKD